MMPLSKSRRTFPVIKISLHNFMRSAPRPPQKFMGKLIWNTIITTWFPFRYVFNNVNNVLKKSWASLVLHSTSLWLSSGRNPSTYTNLLDFPRCRVPMYTTICDNQQHTPFPPFVHNIPFHPTTRSFIVVRSRSFNSMWVLHFEIQPKKVCMAWNYLPHPKLFEGIFYIILKLLVVPHNVIFVICLQF